MDEKDKKKKEEEREPKIEELEGMLRSFRISHGHGKLFNSIKEVTESQKKKMAEEEKITAKPKENIKHLKDEHFIYRRKESKRPTAPGLLGKFFSAYEDVKGAFYKIKELMKVKKYRYPLAALGLFLAIYLLFNLPLIYSRITWHKPSDTQKLIVNTQEVVQKKMADTAPLAAGEVIPAEPRLVVPKLGVNAPIVFATSTDEKETQELLHHGVVHYSGTAEPGAIGNSFITGHSSNYWWDTGKYNQIFVMLDKMEPGDQAIVYYQGKKFVFTVRDKAIVEPTDTSVLAQTDTPVLTLMTCTPPGTSWKRLVVRMDRTDPVFYKPETVTKQKVIEVPKQKETKKNGLLDGIVKFFVPN